MDLAFLAKRLAERGGTERDLYELAGRLAGLGHRVTVYCHEAGPAPDGVAAVLLPASRGGELARIWSLAALGPRAAARGGHDLVIGFAHALRQDIVRCGGGTHRAYLARLAGLDGPLRRAARYANLRRQSMLAIERRQYSPDCYRRVLAISKAVRDDVMATYGVPESRIDIVYDGVDTERFHPRNRARDRARVRAEFGIEEDVPLVLFVGNGFRRKGLDALLAALARGRADSHLLVVGVDRQRARYEALAGRLGLSARVRFAGRQGVPEHFYAAADLFALPAVQEAFGNAVLEALATGLPVVVSACAGAAELLEGGLASGIVAEPGDAGVLAQAIATMLKPGVRDAVAPVARQIAERHTYAHNARGIEEVLERTLAEKRQTGQQAGRG